MIFKWKCPNYFLILGQNFGKNYFCKIFIVVVYFNAEIARLEGLERATLHPPNITEFSESRFLGTRGGFARGISRPLWGNDR